MTFSARNLFSIFFSTTRRDQYLARYLVRECGRGRSPDDVLADPYVVNRSTVEERGRLLERPDVVEAIGEQTIAEMRLTLASAEAERGARR